MDETTKHCKESYFWLVTPPSQPIFGPSFFHYCARWPNGPTFGFLDGWSHWWRCSKSCGGMDTHISWRRGPQSLRAAPTPAVFPPPYATECPVFRAASSPSMVPPGGALRSCSLTRVAVLQMGHHMNSRKAVTASQGKKERENSTFPPRNAAAGCQTPSGHKNTTRI